MAVNITDFISFFFLFSFGIPFVRRQDTNEKHRNDIPLSNDTFSVPKLVFVCMRFFHLPTSVQMRTDAIDDGGDGGMVLVLVYAAKCFMCVVLCVCVCFEHYYYS